MKIVTAFLFIIVMALLLFVEQGMARRPGRAVRKKDIRLSCSCSQVDPGSQAPPASVKKDDQSIRKLNCSCSQLPPAKRMTARQKQQAEMWQKRLVELRAKYAWRSKAHAARRRKSTRRSNDKRRLAAARRHAEKKRQNAKRRQAAKRRPAAKRRRPSKRGLESS